MSRRQTRRGQALIEFAVALPVVLIMMFAIFDVTRLMFIQNSLDSAARAAARRAAMNEPTTSRSDLFRVVLRHTPGVAISPANMAVRHIEGPRGGDFVEVTLRGNYPLLSAFYVSRVNRLNMAGVARAGIRTDLQGGAVHLP
jgi:hypothetical protein